MSHMIDFTTMKKWMPDYANAASIFVNETHTYTMAADGFLALSLYQYGGPASAQTNGPTVSVNGKFILKSISGARASNQATVSNLSTTIPVCANDVVNVTYSSDVAGSTDIVFIPGRWV